MRCPNAHRARRAPCTCKGVLPKVLIPAWRCGGSKNRWWAPRWVLCRSRRQSTHRCPYASGGTAAEKHHRAIRAPVPEEGCHTVLLKVCLEENREFGRNENDPIGAVLSRVQSLQFSRRAAELPQLN